MTSYSPTDLYFPDSDGKPMADNTEQFSWIVLIKENLEILFADDPNVFVAGDLLWYPVKSQLIYAVAPDALVAFGRPKGRRGSYRQWEEDNILIQVVFEILSPSNTGEEMARKFEFYQTYGVEEYYLYNPTRNALTGWIRQGSQLTEIQQISGWISPRLGIRFELTFQDFVIYRPDGDRFLTSIELRQRGDQERQCADQERQRADRLAAYLRSIGVDPDQIPD
ncbi:MAG: Uma2 family endonuclease [Plectolyngbya sp. WJT66-NPBG17]|jgi:Uma2 family endonuclease|nr:Uma2 family endonuclease [Plectolyngbya sp. WJT66-NPBG17]MBW4525005.1 Uma2 family endonuclease [Phormidium tanganyikae FI6-MK23]